MQKVFRYNASDDSYFFAEVKGRTTANEIQILLCIVSMRDLVLISKKGIFSDA